MSPARVGTTRLMPTDPEALLRAAPASEPDPAAAPDDRDLAKVQGNAARALALLPLLDLPFPGERTWARWSSLIRWSAADLTAGRVAEAHLDALAILHEAGATEADLTDLGVTAASTWGVFAAEGPGVWVDACESDDRWTLTGIKPWCSLADQLSHALVTAHTNTGRRLFAVALTDATVTTHADLWVSRGLASVTSGPIDLADTPAVPIGADGWYLDRPGFAWGGMGVAACWYGGSLGLARSLLAAARRREPDQISLMHLGAVDVALHRARVALAAAASAVDEGSADGAAGAVWANRTRTVVADAAEEILLRVGHALGPAPLALQEDHARRVADLTVYLRQHHAERDQAAVGRAALDHPDDW